MKKIVGLALLLIASASFVFAGGSKDGSGTGGLSESVYLCLQKIYNVGTKMVKTWRNSSRLPVIA